MSFQPNVEKCPFCGERMKTIFRSEDGIWDCLGLCFCADIQNNGEIIASGKRVGISPLTKFSSLEEVLRFAKLRTFQ